MIIGISGKMGAGKDILAECIQALDPSFEVKRFAGKLKQVAQILTGIKDQYSYEGKQKYLSEWGMTIGEFQQRLGTEAIRNGLHKDTWVLALFADYTKDQNWIIADVRFLNEADAVKGHDGYLVRIDGTRIHDDNRDHNHPSELALDDYEYFDYRFDNSHLSLEDLAITADFILNETKLL